MVPWDSLRPTAAERVVQVVQTSPGLRVKVIDADGRALYFAQIFQTYANEIRLHGESGVKDRFKKIISTGQKL